MSSKFYNTNLDIQDCMDTVIGLVEVVENIEWLEAHTEDAGAAEELEEYQELFDRHQLSEDETREACWMMENFLYTMQKLGVVEEYSVSEIDKLLAKIGK